MPDDRLIHDSLRDYARRGGSGRRRADDDLRQDSAVCRRFAARHKYDLRNGERLCICRRESFLRMYGDVRPE